MIQAGVEGRQQGLVLLGLRVGLDDFVRRLATVEKNPFWMSSSEIRAIHLSLPRALGRSAHISQAPNSQTAAELF